MFVPSSDLSNGNGKIDPTHRQAWSPAKEKGAPLNREPKAVGRGRHLAEVLVSRKSEEKGNFGEELTMNETRDFPTAVIASISSGVLLCEKFSDMQEAAEFLMGHPIWTHHFASKELWSEMQRTVLEQCPGMPTGGITKDNWREEATRLAQELGPTVKIRKGGGLTAMLPTDGIPDPLKDKTIMIGIDKKD